MEPNGCPDGSRETPRSKNVSYTLFPSFLERLGLHIGTPLGPLWAPVFDVFLNVFHIIFE